MKNKKYFSFGVYKEMLRQTCIAGVIIAISSMLFSAGALLDLGYIDGPEIVNFIDSMYGTKLFLCFVAPISAWLAFSSITNKRKNSDFFHSLPCTRECLYLSTYGAVMTWMIAAIVLSMAVAVITRVVLPQYYIIIYESIIICVFDMIVSTLFSVSAVSLACALTGTALANVVASLTIMFVPAGFFNLLKSSAEYHMLSSRFINTLTPSTYNLYVSNATMLGIINGGLESYKVGVIYTALLAIFYGAVACFFFKRRKSEMSHKPAVSRFWLTVFRTALTVFAFGLIIEGLVDFIEFLFFALFIVVGYFAYELIFTKTWKGLLKTVPGLFLAIAISVVSILSVELWINLANKYQPTADEIKSVRIVDFDDSLYVDVTNDIFDVAMENASKVKICDERINEIIASGIARTYVENNHSPMEYNSRYKTITVAVKSGVVERYRRVSIKYEDYESLLKYLAENEEYTSAFMALPEVREKGIMNLNLYSSGGPVKAPDAVIECLVAEIPTLDFSKWFSYLSGYTSSADTVEVITKEGLSSRIIEIPVKANILPETFNFIKSKHLENPFARSVCAGIFDDIEKVKSGDTSDMVYESRAYEITAQFYIQTPDGMKNYGKTWFGMSYILEENELDEFFDEGFETLSEVVSKTEHETINLDNFVEISFAVTDQYKNYDSVDTAYFTIPEEYIDYFLSLMDDGEFEEVFDY